MSHTFSVSAPTPPGSCAILDALTLPDLRCMGGMPADSPWPEGYVHLYRHGISTRSTEVNYEDGQFRVRVFSLASPEDHDLAFRLVERAAEICRAPVVSESQGEMPAARLRQVHDDAWVQGEIESGARSVAYMVESGETSHMTVPGPARPCYLGSRLLGELRAAGPAEEFAQRMLAAIRRVQYIDPEEYQPAGTFQGGVPAGNSQAITFAVWLPGQAKLFSAVDYLLIDADGRHQDTFLVPTTALPAIAAERMSWLDEKQALVKAFADSDWPALVARARRHALPPLGKRKKWWQFWK